MTKDSTQEEFLAAQLERTGLPLEVETSDLLEKNWLVFNNEPYVDEDEGKTHEIDIFAIHQNETDQLSWVKPPRMFIATDIAIECKKSETHAWVFLTRPKATPPGFGSGQNNDFLRVFSQGQSSFLDQPYLDLPELHFDQIKKVSHTGVQLKLRKQDASEKGGKDEIFEARNQLMKFSSAFMRTWQSAIAGNRLRRDLVFLFTAIVFDGELYEATNANGKWGVKRSDHILLKSARYSKPSGDHLSYLIDVVSKRYLEKYLQVINEDIWLLTNSINPRLEKLTLTSDRLVKTIARPSNSVQTS